MKKACKNNYGGFGYALHVDEHRSTPVELDGVRQIPADVRKKIDRGGEDWLSRDEEALMDATIAEARRDLFALHLAALRAQSGGNLYDADGRYIGGQDEGEND